MSVNVDTESPACTAGATDKADEDPSFNHMAAEQDAMDAARRVRREVQFRGMFAVRLAACGARHTEPERLHLAAQMLSQDLCDHVTMPTDLSNPETSFTDASTGNRLPPVSCAFQRCIWCSKAERGSV